MPAPICRRCSNESENSQRIVPRWRDTRIGVAATGIAKEQEMIERLCIIGVGLIGGSLALALRKSGFVKEIVGNGRDEAHLRKAVELGVVDRYHLVASQAVAGADMVVVAVPLGAMEQVFGDLSTALDYDAVLTDVGSS